MQAEQCTPSWRVGEWPARRGRDVPGKPGVVRVLEHDQPVALGQLLAERLVQPFLELLPFLEIKGITGARREPISEPCSYPLVEFDEIDLGLPEPPRRHHSLGR